MLCVHMCVCVHACAYFYLVASRIPWIGVNDGLPPPVALFTDMPLLCMSSTKNHARRFKTAMNISG